jgi:hypothetical protein
MGKLEIAQSSDAWGVNILKLVSPYGEVGLVHHQGFVGAHAKDGIVYDPADVKIKYLLKTQLWIDLQHKDETYKKDAYITIAGIQVSNPYALAMLDGT